MEREGEKAKRRSKITSALGDPLDAPWTALGSLRGSVGRSGGSWDALWSSSGALWNSSRGLWELRGVILELSETILEAFWDDVRALFLFPDARAVEASI